MLFRLPPEVRRIIWHYVFISPEATARIAFSPYAARHTSVLRVLGVCKSLYREGFHIFYRYNNLELPSACAMYKFLSSLHPKRRSEITALTLSNFGLHYTSYQCASKAFSLLHLCPRLTNFRLDLTTEASWTILIETSDGSSVIDMWEPNRSLFYEALDCVTSLRGLTTVSIRGIDPDRWRKFRNHNFTRVDLEEVKNSRADHLRTVWTLPRNAVSSVRTITTESCNKQLSCD